MSRQIVTVRLPPLFNRMNDPQPQPRQATAPTNPMDGLPETPHNVSRETIHMNGLLVDVYGLTELAALPAEKVSLVWLHNPRGRAKEDMHNIASRLVGTWNDKADSVHNANRRRGLLALAFDQRNHGSRMVCEKANDAWRQGNETHAQDMFGVVNGTVEDQSLLIDYVEGYLFPDGKREVDQHLALGVSLGGHSVWQLMFRDPRVKAGVIVIGCPDYMNMMKDRARLSKLSTYNAEDNGASFFGSKDFPRGLVAACNKYDPKGILFGQEAVPRPEKASLGTAEWNLLERVKGKKFLVCSGGIDKLVPYHCGNDFMDWFKAAAAKQEAFHVEDNVYDGIGHSFSSHMAEDATRFVMEEVRAMNERPSSKM